MFECSNESNESHESRKSRGSRVSRKSRVSRESRESSFGQRVILFSLESSKVNVCHVVKCLMLMLTLGTC